MGSMIASFDFDQAEDGGSDGKRDVQIEMLESIKQTIEKNPEEALESINFLLEQMKKQSCLFWESNVDSLKYKTYIQDWILNVE